MVKKVSGPDCIPVVVLKKCEPELSYILQPWPKYMRQTLALVWQGLKNLVHARIVHQTCTKHPFEEHKILCSKIKYTATKIFWI